MEDRPPKQPSGDTTTTAKATTTIQSPKQAHIVPDYQQEADDELEATELRTVKRPRLTRVLSDRPQTTTTTSTTSSWHDSVRKVWRHNVRLSVPHLDCRDHLANERTYLAYLRTSLALSMVGIVVAQLYRLHHSSQPSMVFGFFVLGKPLACIFQVAALLMTLIGCMRFYRQQSAMARGKVHTSGAEIWAVAVLVFLLLFAMFVIHVAVDAYKSIEEQ